MAQVLKQAVRDKILTAAETLFMEKGYKNTTMNQIAESANVAVGNIYKYFPNKETLLDFIITDDFLAEFRSLTDQRVQDLNTPETFEQDQSLESGSAKALLSFLIRNRQKVVIVLAKAEGTKYAAFQGDYIQSMIDFSEHLIPDMRPKLKTDQIFSFTFQNCITSTVRNMALILETFDDALSIQNAFAASWAYHHAGISNFVKWQSSE